jgi:hypothetical protein
MPKKEKGEMEYWTVPIDRKAPRGTPINQIRTKPDDYHCLSTLRSQATNYLNFYKKNYNCPNFNEVREGLMDALSGSANYLVTINSRLFDFVYDYLDCHAELILSCEDKAAFKDEENKSRRLAKHLNYHLGDQPQTIYISGQSGWDYLDEDEFKKDFNATIMYQFEAGTDFYHGSILHYMLTMNRLELPEFIRNQFRWQMKNSKYGTYPEIYTSLIRTLNEIS